MKRRNVVKGLSAALGGAMLPQSAWSRVFEPEETPLASPIRGLVRRNGRLCQPIRITVSGCSSGASLVTTVDGIEADHRSASGPEQAFDVFVDPVEVNRASRIVVTVNGTPKSAEVELKPVRKLVVYVLPHSHHDLGYTDLQANVEEKQINNILQGMELAQKTANYPEGARFVWNLEVLWGADLFLKRRPESDHAALRDAVQNRWVGLNGSYANELTGLCRPEELVELFRFGTRLGKQFSTPVRSAMMSDVPGFTWGTVSAMAQAGIRYFSAAPNYFDRIGTFMVAWQDKPFWWISPSGRERVLFWVPWTGYAMSHVNKLGNAWVGKYQDRMDAVQFPYSISYIRWSGHGDNAAPDPELSEWVKGWNDTYEWPKFHISTTEYAFAKFEETHGKELPEFRGDLTPYWEDGAASSAAETALNRNAAEKIVQAEALAAAFHPDTYNAPHYAEAWRNVLLYSEHTWGAWNSVSDSENPFVTTQWEVKRAFAVQAAELASALARQVVEPAPAETAQGVTVWNTTSWERSDVVLLRRDQSAAGDRVEDQHGKPVPSQRLASGELAFWVASIAPLSARSFRILGQSPSHPSHPVTVHAHTLENESLRVTLDEKTGDLVELVPHHTSINCIDTATGAANRFLFLSGTDLEHLGRSGTPKITVEDSGPLVATLRIESSAPACNSLTRRVRLMAGLDYVVLENTVDKRRAPLNPNPGKADQGGSFAQSGSKESIQFQFPLHVPEGKMTMDVPLAVMRPEIDQLPGSCKNWLPVGRWIDVSSPERGVTWATLDAPLVEIGAISATMLGSQKNPDIWRKTIGQTQLFYSWVMNNHWGTNYRAYQQGPVTFRYALRPHQGESAAGKERFATGLTQPLIVSPTPASAPPADPLVRVSSPDVLIQSLKPSDDGAAWIVRLFGASGQNRDITLAWSGRASAGRTWISNLAEEPLTPVRGPIAIAGWQLVTLRTECLKPEATS